jgi:hypothetical protein
VMVAFRLPVALSPDVLKRAACAIGIAWLDRRNSCSRRASLGTSKGVSAQHFSCPQNAHEAVTISLHFRHVALDFLTLWEIAIVAHVVTRFLIFSRSENVIK